MLTNKNKLLAIKTGGLFLVLNLLFVAGCSRKSATEYEGIPVTVAAVEQKTAPLDLESFGTAEAYSTITIRSQVTGILTKVYFTEGQLVKKGDLLFTIDPRPFEAALKQAQANLARDKAQLTNAEKELARQTDLLGKGFASQNDFDQSKTAADALRATIEADEAAVEYARLQLEYCSIKSPIDGLTGMLLVNEGNLVKPNDTSIITINQIKPIYITFTVPQQHLPQIQKYMAVNKLVVAADRPLVDEQAITGWLTFVDNAVDNSTGTIRLRATFDNEDGRLWPGQYTNITLTLAQEPNAIVIPSQAIQTGQTGTFVYVVKPDRTVEARPITVHRSINNESVVAGVTADEVIVTDGQFGLVPGAKVSIKNPAQK
jgi:multidrug efflux system membrane fusion protein